MLNFCPYAWWRFTPFFLICKIHIEQLIHYGYSIFKFSHSGWIVQRKSLIST